MIRRILQLESLFFFLGAVYLYSKLQGDWIFFIVLLLTPDISLLGYRKNPKVGAVVYNLVHNYILALLLILFGFISQNFLITQLGIILFAHVSMDRFFGFGLKESTGFKHTHLGKIGK